MRKLAAALIAAALLVTAAGCPTPDDTSTPPPPVAGNPCLGQGGMRYTVEAKIAAPATDLSLLYLRLDSTTDTLDVAGDVPLAEYADPSPMPLVFQSDVNPYRGYVCWPKDQAVTVTLTGAIAHPTAVGNTITCTLREHSTGTLVDQQAHTVTQAELDAWKPGTIDADTGCQYLYAP